MMIRGKIRVILLHGSSDEAFDPAVAFARQLAESFAARLHVVYTVEEPLSAGWTAEVSADRLPEIHQAMEAEARQWLERTISMEDQERLGVEIALCTGPTEAELVRYTNEHAVDLAIVVAPASHGGDTETARALLDRGRCAVLVLR